jgi:hypothetical protein
MRYFTLVVFTIVFITTTSAQTTTDKKVIQFGWNMPKPAQVRDNIASMEQMPFDGLVVRTTVVPSPFLKTAYPDSAFEQDITDLQATNFNRFTDNWLVLYSGVEQGWSWLDDNDWASTEQNMRNYVRTVRESGFVGLFFDSESYGVEEGSWSDSPWTFYPDKYPNITREELQAVVYERGARFMQVMQTEMPNIKFLFTYLTNMMVDNLGYPLEQRTYFLMPAFLDGMLSVASGNVQLIDGNEFAYYYTRTDEYTNAQDILRNGASLLGLTQTSAYDTHVKMAQSVYVDSVMNWWQYTRYIGFHLPDDATRLNLLEWNIGEALQHTDEYVWVYSENMDWWNGQAPSDIVNAVQTAQDYYTRGEAIPIDQTIITQSRQALDSMVYVWGQITLPDGSGANSAELSSGLQGRQDGDAACGVYNTEGWYNCLLPLGWSGQLTAVLEGYTFEPVTITNLNGETELHIQATTP